MEKETKKLLDFLNKKFKNISISSDENGIYVNHNKITTEILYPLYSPTIKSNTHDSLTSKWLDGYKLVSEIINFLVDNGITHTINLLFTDEVIDSYNIIDIMKQLTKDNSITLSITDANNEFISIITDKSINRASILSTNNDINEFNVGFILKNIKNNIIPNFHVSVSNNEFGIGLSNKNSMFNANIYNVKEPNTKNLERMSSVILKNPNWVALILGKIIELLEDLEGNGYIKNNDNMLLSFGLEKHKDEELSRATVVNRFILTDSNNNQLIDFNEIMLSLSVNDRKRRIDLRTTQALAEYFDVTNLFIETTDDRLYDYAKTLTKSIGDTLSAYSIKTDRNKLEVERSVYYNVTNVSLDRIVDNDLLDTVLNGLSEHSGNIPVNVMDAVTLDIHDIDNIIPIAIKEIDVLNELSKYNTKLNTNNLLKSLLNSVC